ncbi:SRPBCC family protein [Kitasatospora sp. DSM 101779]|uniref:SRPBCC family protein n=1 Tax=Kitasatospora sp. DSM 101779 TaxID=2853165 RepID=UPI0021D9EDF8|nr:SRPBCC domain-containing protein [Kitasatospora sp. DSM 101779]MCU7822754.1 SRPBCC domain-containing protein [Kitasatospora sp. DSM 101779]
MPTGLTGDAGWQIGVSRTLPHPPEELWRLVTSARGTALWLGEGVHPLGGPGTRYGTADGTTGEVRSHRPGSRLRLTRRPPGRAGDTVLQVTVSPAPHGAVLRFHQERLADAAERERQRAHWAAVIDALERLGPGA